MFMSLKETTHQQEAVTHPQTSLSLDIFYTNMATIGQEQDHRSVLEYVHILHVTTYTLNNNNNNNIQSLVIHATQS